MGSFLDDVMEEVGVDLLQDALGERDKDGKLDEKAVVLIDPKEKEHPLGAIVGEFASDPDIPLDSDGGEVEWDGRQERLEVILLGDPPRVTDAWRVRVAAHPGGSWSVDQVRRNGAGLKLELTRPVTQRIQKSGYE